MHTATLDREPADTSHDASDTGEATQQSPEWTGESFLARARSDAYATACMLRPQIAPHAATAALAGAGFAAEAVATTGVVSPGTLALSLAGLAFPTAGWIGGWAKRRGSQWSGRLLFGGLAGAAWLTMAPYGAGVESAAALVACEYALAARWWQRKRIGYPTDTPEPAVEVDDTPTVLTPVEQIIADWDEFIACSGGPLQNSRLSCPEETEHGYRFMATLWRGRHSLTTAIAAIEKIAGGLDCGVDQVIIESAPQETHPLLKKSPARCRFQLITNSPIAGDVVFDGPRRRGGLLELGPYADGSGEAVYRLYTRGSMWSGVIIGGTGIGKSRVVENIVISALSGGDTEFWYLDPNRGGSSPALAKHADWFVTMDQVDDMLDAAIAELDARNDENSVEEWTGFTPSPQRPGHLIVVEECHNPFADAARAAKWARIAREGRKVGMAILCVSQYPGLITFGGNEALRSSVMEGNALVLRSTSNQTGQLMAGLTVDPKTLPKIPGYAYVQGSEETGIRTAPFRNRDTQPESGPGADLWLAAQPRPGLDTLSATATLAAGTAYRDRHTSTTAGRAGSRARVEALRTGHLPADMLKGTPEDTTVEVAKVIQFPVFVPPGEDSGPGEATPMPAGLTSSHEAVLAAVTAGIDRPSEIEKRVGLKHRRVAALLKDLLDWGHIVQPRHGRYQRAA